MRWNQDAFSEMMQRGIQPHSLTVMRWFLFAPNTCRKGATAYLLGLKYTLSVVTQKEPNEAAGTKFMNSAHNILISFVLVPTDFAFPRSNLLFWGSFEFFDYICCNDLVVTRKPVSDHSFAILFG